MRLTKVKLAGFKSFVDPTTVQFPSNLTGVVGPNGCGKSNVIDAVRWVMGELSARHLRGDSMTDVIFNGSSARKPVGNASVELVFDNSDGKISGVYASYNEVSLKRVVARDGTSSYFINSARCRRKDITTLFLGTGLGARSYAIIEQGMISRVIEARSEDMRAFVEEAAGISRYKERRRETEARVSDTRENLERLQDVRDEIEKQIRHLQRQATTARKYQDLKNEERRLGAELLALRLREIDSGAAINDRAVRACDLVLQQALAEQRAAEAGVEKQREYQAGEMERVTAIQGRYFEQGAEVSRTEQTLSHTRELRDRRRAELTRANTMLEELAAQVARDEALRARLNAEIAELAPGAEQAQLAEQARARALEEADEALQVWQQQWEEFNRKLGGTNQTTQVERARIEQLEDQLRRLGMQADRLAIENEQLLAADASAGLTGLEGQESQTRLTGDELAASLQTVLGALQDLRGEQHATESRLESVRAEREKARSELMSLEALQKVALGERDRESGKWLASAGLAARPRVAEQLTVAGGWERGVEAVLGDYLEAVCVEGLDPIAASLDRFDNGHVMLVEPGAADAAVGPDSLGAQVQGPAAIVRRLAGIQTASSLADALARRRSLGPTGSFVTPKGEWVGRDWLRVVRGADVHAGVIEREHRIKALRQALDGRETATHEVEAQLGALRARVAETERQRDSIQTGIQSAHRAHNDARGQLEAARARSQQSTLRRERITREAGEVASEQDKAQQALTRARDAYEAAAAELELLDARRHELEAEREERRAATNEARSHAQSAQARARELLIQLEGRRSTEASMGGALQRMLEQRQQIGARQAQLEDELRGSDEPVRELEQRLNEALSRRLEVEAELAAARRELDSADAELRQLDEKRLHAEHRVGAARDAMETAKLAAQESRLRRESLAEQFAATRFDLEEVLAALSAEAEVPRWEDRLGAVVADLLRLGQVNLAAIDELKEQSERKTYLDAQYKDLTDALDTLEQAMRKIDKETRTRFEDTFNRINTGLQEKFPRLFGGGHAYLEIVGDDILTAGVAVMARPPGKRNVTINQLSGGEKALTAVALVFSIFDLNPAPFCLLDEVDAPLDEHNVGRFCEIVREMSERVQFIFITHNKTTMELASQLVGVTMHEPGVSRMVTVDVAEAVRLAAV
jgi:chromosome segregation protein